MKTRTECNCCEIPKAVNIDMSQYFADAQPDCDACFEQYVAESYREMWDARYGGAFVDVFGNVIFIKKVVYSNPKVIVIWNDDTTSSATCSECDKVGFNFEAGLNIAINNRLYGKNEMRRLYEDWLPTTYIDNINMEESYEVSIKDVRNRHKMIRRIEDAEVKQIAEDELINYLKERGYTVTKTKVNTKSK